MNKAKDNPENGKIADLLRDLFIASLGASGVKQTEIRKIVGCKMNRVNRIVKHIERGRRHGKESE